MTSMLKYLAIMIVFYLVADRLVKGNYDRIVQIISDTAMYLLVFTMGTRIGANEEVISRLGTVGIHAIVSTALAFFGSISMAFFARAFIMLDRHSLGEKSIKDTVGIDNEADESKESNGFKATGIILALVAAGMAAGHFVLPQVITDLDGYQDRAGSMIDMFLCILLGGVGYGLGREGEILKKFKAIGFRVFALPIAIISGTAVMGLAYGVYGPLSIKESMAVFMGMGWYGMAPAIIMNTGHVTAAAISFLHNILREVMSMLLIPIVASKIGYFEAASLPAATGMDCCLPAVKRYTNNETAIMSLISGIICSIAVPVLVPLIIG